MTTFISNRPPLTCPPPPKLSDLHPPLRKLVLRMQDIGFGRIENLRIKGGLPIADAASLVIQTHKPLSDPTRSHYKTASDFELAKSVIELVATLREIDTGVLPLITVQHGVPLTWETESSLVL